MEPHSTFQSSSAKESPVTIYFVRHAQAEKSDGDVEAKSDPPITDLGKRQAERVARRLLDIEFSHIYVSSMRRARQTADIITSHHSGVKMSILPGLKEVSHFHFLEDLAPDDPEIRMALTREKDMLHHFVNHIRHTHKGGEQLLIVCHGNIIRTLMPIFGGKNPSENVLIEINNTAVSILDVWSNGEAVVILANCVKHLLPKQVT